MFKYEASDEVVVFLVNEKMNGAAKRRLAADFILYCLRSFHSCEEIADCIDDLEERAIFDVAKDARRLASSLGLIG
jgi:hypothetical protein